ncbi:MAG: hypothetical protein WBQ68_20730 [Terriglobales bacterium]
MKHIQYLSAAALALLLLLPATTFAKDKNKDKDKNEGTLMLSSPVQVGSAMLEPGTYKVEWQDSGSTANVDILQGDKTVATVPATVVSYTDHQDEAITHHPADDPQKQTLEEIDFAKQKQGLRLTPSGQN